MDQQRRPQNSGTHQRVSVAELNGDERDAQDCRRGETRDRDGRGPPDLGSAHDREDEQQQCTGARESAQCVELSPVHGCARRCRDHAQPREEQRKRDRSREQKRCAPGEFGQQSTEDQTEREATRSAHGVDTESLVASGPLGERRRDDRQARGHGERGGDPLDEAQSDDDRIDVDDGARDRGDAEHPQGHQEHPAAAEQITCTPAQQQQTAVAQHISAHDPLQLRLTHVEVFADRRQCDTDHRDVEAVEEERSRQNHKEQPYPSGPPRRGSDVESGDVQVRRWLGRRPIGVVCPIVDARRIGPVRDDHVSCVVCHASNYMHMHSMRIH